MIELILAGGALSVLCSILIRQMKLTTRGLVCWTISSIAFVISAVVFFAGAAYFTPDMRAVAIGACAVGVLISISLLIELLAPSKRLRYRDREEYDIHCAEISLNLVFVIITSVLTVIAFAAEIADLPYLTAVAIIPGAAISVRQLSYFLYRAKVDTRISETDEQRRDDALKKFKTVNRGL